MGFFFRPKTGINRTGVILGEWGASGESGLALVVGGCERARGWVREGKQGTGFKLIVDYKFRQKVSLLLCTSSNFYKGTVEWRLQAIVPNLVPNVLL